MAQLKAALVLCDIVAHGLKAGEIVEASPDLVAALKDTGELDPHKDAVAAARERGAATVRSSIEMENEAKAARAAEIRIEIAKLEDLASKPETDEATKNALAEQVHALRAVLASLT